MNRALHAHALMLLSAGVNEDRERIVQPENPGEVIAGEDEIPRQPAPPLDPYTPEPGPRAGERRAFAWMRWAWIAILIGIAVVVYAAVR
jgi:hypothetical protein